MKGFARCGIDQFFYTPERDEHLPNIGRVQSLGIQCAPAPALISLHTIERDGPLFGPLKDFWAGTWIQCTHQLPDIIERGTLFLVH